ncbi:ATP-grasp domain-containing protein [Serratia marcescens]|nr:ATP-grasp domain-containing protein [Serratia marcescens]ELQ9441488.1 ATP-grasp domain-containing protein [Serratia marcescens]ELT5562568.1 ATP-grasp domain-containing protein [Serratia marcescens]
MNILIIGSGFSPIHNKLKSLGHRLFLIPDPERKVNIDENNIYEAVHFVVDAESVESLALDICADTSIFSIDRVMAFNEKWQLIAARVASYANLPSILDIELVKRTIDKYYMRMHLEVNNFPTVNFERVANFSSLYGALVRVGFPAILKPLSGEASRDIYFINDEQTYHQLFGSIENKFDEEFLVESFVCGDEYSIEAVSYEGQHYILAVTKKFKNDNFIEIGHVLPAPISSSLEMEIHEYIRKFLTVMQFNNCPSHTEIIMSENGPVVIESHTRPGGDNIYRLLEFSTGISLMNLVAKISSGSLSKNDLQVKEDKCFSAIWYSYPEGNEKLILESVTGVDEAKAPSYIKDISIMANLGDKARKVRNSFDRSAYAIATGKNANEALLNAKNALSNISFNYKLVDGD